MLAPDDGIISARTATVGSLTKPGQELFRLIRGGRLEWRAEVAAAELARLKPGQAATLDGPNGDAVEGAVRAVAPTVDPQTRNGWSMSTCRQRKPARRSAPACSRAANSSSASARR